MSDETPTPVDRINALERVNLELRNEGPYYVGYGKERSLQPEGTWDAWVELAKHILQIDEEFRDEVEDR